MDLLTLSRRVAEIRAESGADPRKALRMEHEFYQDLLQAIADQNVEDPADFALFGLTCKTFEYDRWSA